MDPQPEAVARLVARVEGKACWLARLATRAAVAGGAAALVLWWVAAGDRVTDWWRGTAGSLLVLVLVAAPAAWLVNVRFALLELVELPEKLGGVASRRLRRRSPVERPAGGPLDGVRSLWGVLRDSADVVGAWGAVAQLVTPPFWLLTTAAFVAVPVLVAAAAVAGLVDLLA